MKRSSHIITLLICLNIAFLPCQTSYQNYSLTPGIVQTVILQPNVVVTLSLPGIGPRYHYAMIQFHCQRWNLTLSSSSEFRTETSAWGPNVGMVASTEDHIIGNTTLFFYLRSNNATTNITAVGIFRLLSPYDPLPGGCNQVFNLEKDPNVHITYSTGRTDILFQWANQAAKIEPSCELSQVQKNLEYDIYVYFLDPMSLSEDDFISGVKDLMTSSSIKDKAQKITTLSNTPKSKPQLFVTSQENRGVIYSIVARLKDTGNSASYVAGVTYSCSFEDGGCTVKVGAGDIILTLVSTVCGIFLLFFGHRMFKTSQWIFGYIFSFLLIYLLMKSFQVTSDTNIFIIAGCLGVVGGAIWLSMWLLFAFPIAAVMVPGLCAGYLMAATVFFTPLGNLDWWERNENYALSFVCVILLYTVLLMALSKFFSILSCSLVGAYLLLMAAAMPLRSSLWLIMSYSFHRQTLENFENVMIVVPNRTEDIVLMVLWPTLAIIGIIFQFYRQKGRPDFDLPVRRRRRGLEATQPLNVDTSEEEILNEGISSDETQSLIADGNRQNRKTTNYHTVDNTSPDRGGRRRERNLLA